MREHRTDYLVIGSGIAGLYAALILAESGEVSLLTKSRLTESNSYFAQGGMAAAMAPKDSPKLHREDTLAAGAGLCNTPAVEVLVGEGPRRVRHLLSLGVPFDMSGDEIALTREGAHSLRRVLHAQGDATGRAISEHLAQKVRENPRIHIHEQVFVSQLLHGQECRGALTLSPTGESEAWLARATVLATGGAGQIYSQTTNPSIATADGIALAYRAGAAVMDLEFVQFHPTVLYHPQGEKKFLLTEALRGEGAVLRNGRGDQFMPGYHPLGDLAPRDVVSRSIIEEMEREGEPCVYLDATHLAPELIRGRFPTVWQTCKEMGYDLLSQMVPVRPAAHYFMGGVRSSLLGESTLPGLFVCGEVACTGVHGANRLASNSLLETIVFGARAAWSAENWRPSSHEISEPLGQEESPSLQLAETRRRLGEMMTQDAGICRSGPGLTQVREWLRDLPEQARSVEGWELANMVLTARLLVESALEREESRGAHSRSDFPRLAPTPYHSQICQKRFSRIQRDYC